MALSLPPLVVCIVIVAGLRHDRLNDQLTLVLALCTVFASVAWIALDERLLVDASFVPSILAIAFLDPTTVFALVVVGELASWAVRPYRSVVIPINILSLGAPALIASTAFGALRPEGIAFYILLGTAGSGALALNAVLVTSLMGVLDGAPILSSLRAHLRLVPAIAINVLLALAAARLYANEGLGAITVALVSIFAFNYMVGHMLTAQRRAKRIAELASSRQWLLAEALNAEDRERRKLAERLHDDVLQDVLLAQQDLAEVRRGRRASLATAEKALEKALRQLRGEVLELHPSVLEHGGLESALEEVAEQEGRLGKFRTELAIDPHAIGVRDRLLLAVSRELLRNVAKHAGAREVRLQISRTADALVLEIRDDGRGVDEYQPVAATRAGHIGLASITARVEAVGGRFEIFQDDAPGAHFRAVFPVREEGYLASASTTSAAAGGPQDPILAQ